jgi:hypothetical protein
MSTMAMSVPFDTWCVDYHKTMAAAFTVGNAVRRSASILELAKDFWSLSRNLRTLLNDLETTAEIPCEHVRQLSDKLRELHTKLDETLELARKRGFTNRTLTSVSIEALRSSNARLQDYLERLELSLDPTSATDAAEALADYKRGDTVSLDSLR